MKRGKRTEHREKDEKLGRKSDKRNTIKHWGKKGDHQLRARLNVNWNDMEEKAKSRKLKRYRALDNRGGQRNVRRVVRIYVQNGHNCTFHNNGVEGAAYRKLICISVLLSIFHISSNALTDTHKRLPGSKRGFNIWSDLMTVMDLETF